MSLLGILGLLFFSACSSDSGCDEVDGLNTRSYAFRYRNVDSTYAYAFKALSLAGGYSAGKAEAYNNLAFADMAKMDYGKAYVRLDSVRMTTDNQVELLVADVMNMRLCQRESKNKDFYDYKELAVRRMKRIGEERETLSDHLKQRLVFAETEFAIVSSTYYYYVGLNQKAAEALEAIDATGEIRKDTAQYLNYLYQLGSGGIINESTKEATAQKEFEHLVRCLVLAKQHGMVYWQANALQSISEHLLDRNTGKYLIDSNKEILGFINSDNMPDSLLAGNLAEKSLELFMGYGDVYQTAGALRTLSFCYCALGDYPSALICLENALSMNDAIEKAPAQVASIRECLSMVFAALNDKYNSDINRNAYLDIQDETRQDRQLEARAEQLERTSVQLNWLIVFILVFIVVVVVLLYVFAKIGKSRNSKAHIDNLLLPLTEWEESNKQKAARLDDEHEAVNELLSISRLQLEKAKRRGLDNKAKFFLVSNVMPYIDRIINETNRLKANNDTEEVRKERFAYMAELTDKINEYNDVLTHWIQLQQGQLSLRIESFNLKEVFDVLAKSETAFNLKGIDLKVESPDAVVKADKTLTLFMLNTLADNARKYTPAGGTVSVYAVNKDDYVEISVKDTGIGLSQDELSGIFDHKIRDGHGFGLMNCKGIIGKYKKISKIFNVCELFAEGEKGRGCRFYFRLPYGVMRCVILLLALCAGTFIYAANGNLEKAGAFADSAYYANVNAEYGKALVFADSARLYLNRHYKSLFPNGTLLMRKESDGDGEPAELHWFRDKVETDYDVILDIRNESAVAALALHEWDLYSYNNKIYTSLFKERSADSGLGEYCQTMQDSSTNKAVAVVMLVFLLVVIVVSFYFLYYRHVLYFRFCMESVDKANKILLSGIDDEEKLSLVNEIDISKYPQQLQDVISKIKEALARSVREGKSQETAIELAKDELHRIEYETGKLYICNNVVDNCLSTLKHETMYYPSRIRLLVDDADKNTDAIGELADYYKELYSVLCEQTRRQTEAITFECKPVQLKHWTGLDELVMGDETLLSYFFEVVKGKCGYENGDVTVHSSDNKYLTIDVRCRKLNLTEGQSMDLFAPQADNIPYLICRQIMREIAEQTNLHACGIAIVTDDNGKTMVRVTLPKAFKVGRLYRTTS